MSIARPSSTSSEGSTADAEPWASFRQSLFEDGILLDTGVDGIYGRSATYESIIEAVDRLSAAAGSDLGAIKLRFPPVMPWATFEKNGYLESFPDQMGSVHTFRGDERAHAELLRRTEAHEDRGPLLETTELVLCPAACHALYPTQSGILPEGGKHFEVDGYCFRREPSTDPFRMQSFRMHEFVYLGTEEGAREHRDEWISRGIDVLVGLGLEVEAVVANDPFFGRPGRMLAANQRSEELKFEIVTPVFATRRETAISSSNWHLDHFSKPFEIYTANGELAHSACFGFGVDRITLALLDHHGTDPNTWPVGVRSSLWP